MAEAFAVVPIAIAETLCAHAIGVSSDVESASSTHHGKPRGGVDLLDLDGGCSHAGIRKGCLRVLVLLAWTTVVPECAGPERFALMVRSAPGDCSPDGRDPSGEPSRHMRLILRNADTAPGCFVLPSRLSCFGRSAELAPQCHQGANHHHGDQTKRDDVAEIGLRRLRRGGCRGQRAAMRGRDVDRRG